MKTAMRMMIVAFSLCLSTTGQSATWRVELDGSGDFLTIQPAFDAAAAGDTILIGPGEYPEFVMQQPPGWGSPIPIGGYKYFYESSSDPLTILGASAEETIIGPDSNLDGFDMGFYITGEDVPLKIKDLTLKTWDQGVTTGHRQVTIENFRGICAVDFSIDYIYDAFISDCYFELGLGIGMGHSQDVEIVNCEFVDAELIISDIQNAQVRDCTLGGFDGGIGGIQFQGGSTGIVENCSITDARVGVGIINSSVGLFNNYIDGSNVSLYPDGLNTHLYGSNNIIAGAEGSSMVAFQSTSFDFHGNHILHEDTPGSYSVWCGGFYYPPVQEIDLTGNYWGTDDADQIAEWIFDYNDDPETHALVLYEPFEGGPVPTENKTWSEVKSMYR